MWPLIFQKENHLIEINERETLFQEIFKANVWDLLKYGEKIIINYSMLQHLADG